MNRLHKNILSQHTRLLIKLQRKFIGQGATYQKNTNDVKLKGKFLKSRKPDMPTLIWLPEVMDPVENFEKFFNDPKNRVLDYRNVWLLNPRNFGDSDHHDSFSMDEVVEDIRRFIDEKKLSMVTIGGHGYGAKIACAFGTTFLDRTTGVMCLDGGPIDNTYHKGWHDAKSAINSAYTISKSVSSTGEFIRKLDKEVIHPKWGSIIKQNIVESTSGLSFKFNLDRLYINANKPRSDISKFSEAYGLFPGRAFVQFAAEGDWVHLSTNTIPIYKFFPKLEGCFPSNSLNFIQSSPGLLCKLLYHIFFYLYSPLAA
jgi:pimeloyl-ACP methyl ester carboxylesterase